MSLNSDNSARNIAEIIEENRANGWADLTDTQKLFAFKYVEHYNVAQSAREIGVSEATLYKWLRDPLVLEFINEQQAHLNRRSVIQRDFVALQALRILPKLLGEEPVHIYDRGTVMECQRFHASEAVSLIKELFKITSDYPELGDGEVPPLNINFTVNDPVSDIKVTRGRDRDS